MEKTQITNNKQITNAKLQSPNFYTLNIEI